LAAGIARARVYVEGQNLQIEYRYTQGRSEHAPALIAELIAFDPEIIVTTQSNPAITIHTTAPSIPLVFIGLGDPVGLGLVESLAHPGGNVTGISAMVPEGFAGKLPQLLKDLARISHTGWEFEGRPRQLHADIVAMKVHNLRESRRTQWWCCDWRCRI
jgi:hypothetical protein